MSNFKRTIEDFTCGNCKSFVNGDGYTNHCPNCLWSKHVDINPGDRESECCGMMKPKSYEKNSEEISITHKCLKCGEEKKNRTSENDNFEKLLKINIQ